jgi:lysozyme family protein
VIGTPAFQRAVALLLVAEGGETVSNDPDDPGGLTKWGISQKAYPLLDIKNLTREDAEAIYLRDYWTPAGCDSLPEPLAIALFDSAANQGVSTAIRIFQRAVGVHVDGIMGPRTAGAATRGDVVGILTSFVEKRWDHYHDIKGSASKFLRGWTRRLFRLQAACLLSAVRGEA